MISLSLTAALPYFPVPLRTLPSERVKLLVLCEYANHPTVSGNKWWKLKYNLQQAISQGYKTLLTFGGAYSNHIHATAHAAQLLGLASIGIIRGEETLPLNSTLADARAFGMRLVYATREQYRQKESPEFLRDLKRQYDNYYYLPEGGTNQLAILGCTEWGKILTAEINFDYLCLGVGTGGTLAGLANGIGQQQGIVGIPVLKNAQFLEKIITDFTAKKIGGSITTITLAAMATLHQSCKLSSERWKKPINCLWILSIPPKPFGAYMI